MRTTKQITTGCYCRLVIKSRMEKIVRLLKYAAAVILIGSSRKEKIVSRNIIL